MKMNKLTVFICVAAILGTIGITSVFAATNNSAGTQANTTQGQKFARGAKMGGTQLTAEQKAQMKANRAAMQAKVKDQQAKLAALTDQQKAEIYALKDEQAAVQVKMIDKYLELGLIDSDQATKMKEEITTRTTQMKDSGKIPMMGIGGGRGQGGMRGGKPGNMPLPTDTTTPVQ